jgi:hypothetical protein
MTARTVRSVGSISMLGSPRLPYRLPLGDRILDGIGTTAAEHATIFNRQQFFEQERLPAKTASTSFAWEGCRNEVRAGRVGRPVQMIETLRLVSDDLDTDLHACIANDSRWPGYELPNFICRLLTEGASHLIVTMFGLDRTSV